LLRGEAATELGHVAEVGLNEKAEKQKFGVRLHGEILPKEAKTDWLDTIIMQI
jgi:hypothetical protein